MARFYLVIFFLCTQLSASCPSRLVIEHARPQMIANLGGEIAAARKRARSFPLATTARRSDKTLSRLLGFVYDETGAPQGILYTAELDGTVTAMRGPEHLSAVDSVIGGWPPPPSRSGGDGGDYDGFYSEDPNSPGIFDYCNSAVSLVQKARTFFWITYGGKAAAAIGTRVYLSPSGRLKEHPWSYLADWGSALTTPFIKGNARKWLMIRGETFRDMESLTNGRNHKAKFVGTAIANLFDASLAFGSAYMESKNLSGSAMHGLRRIATNSSYLIFDPSLSIVQDYAVMNLVPLFVKQICDRYPNALVGIFSASMGTVIAYQLTGIPIEAFHFYVIRQALGQKLGGALDFESDDVATPSKPIEN
ncbi:MAG: hypothetical protein HY537_06975 [Deltaproteobacteria bacterium]|nr:hypothetical protein [Deltaproteobacteria bacterium]